MVRIKSMTVTTESPCTCGSWIEHWKKYSGQTLACCVEVSCTGKDLVGAHVQKADTMDSDWYIIPLCQAHSKMQGEIEVSDNYKLVSADTLETCERVRWDASSLPPPPPSESPKNY
jgi:hypothetical protein